jgi:hypothetical protein
MYFEINVSLNGKHFFATSKRSATNDIALNALVLVFAIKFPIEEGYEISISKNPEVGYICDFHEVLQEAKDDRDADFNR